jgi:hypothetical protein
MLGETVTSDSGESRLQRFYTYAPEFGFWIEGGNAHLWFREEDLHSSVALEVHMAADLEEVSVRVKTRATAYQKDSREAVEPQLGTRGLWAIS